MFFGIQIVFGEYLLSLGKIVFGVILCLWNLNCAWGRYLSFVEFKLRLGKMFFVRGI